jgi:rubrerythrin
MHTKERIEAIEVAMENEAREQAFYLKHSERTKNPLGKKMFKTLSEEEQEHKERIQVLHQRLREQGRWPEDLPLEIGGTQVKEIFRSVVASVDRLPESDRNDLEAIQIAIEFENNGEIFYRRLAESAENSAERDFFNFLAQMEHEHLMSLRETLEYFQNPEGWYTAKERHGLDGA